MHRYIHIFVDVPLLNRENSDLKSSKNKFYCFRFFTNSTQDSPCPTIDNITKGISPLFQYAFANFKRVSSRFYVVLLLTFFSLVLEAPDTLLRPFHIISHDPPKWYKEVKSAECSPMFLPCSPA